MKMGILNLSKASQVTKTDTEGVQNQYNLRTVHSRLIPTINLKKQMEIQIFCYRVQTWTYLLSVTNILGIRSLVTGSYMYH